MSTRRKIIAAGILIVGVLAVVLYMRLSQNPAAPGQSQGLFPGSSSNSSGADSSSGGNTLPTTTVSGGAGGTAVPLLRQITTAPVAGVTSFQRGNEEIIRYIERDNGNVYETRANSLATTRLSNMTVPRIQEAYWYAGGNGLILRYLDNETIKTFSATIATSTGIGEGRLVGGFLPDNITALAVNPAGTKIFYLKNTPTGSAGVLANPDGSKGSAILSSQLRDWNLSWPAENTVLLNTKASAGASYAYDFDIQKKTLLSVAGGLNDLTATQSPDLKAAFYSGFADTFKSFVLSGGVSSENSLATYPEKCAWQNNEILLCGTPLIQPAAGMLEAWYRGEVSFSDALWSINVKTGITNLITVFDGSGTNMDVVNPLLSAKGTHFLFINKNDLTLWSVALPQ